MSRFAYDLRDAHTRAFDSTVVATQLNPGVPVLLLGAAVSTEHYGAVTTVLADSTVLVLRVVPNHPLNLQPEAFYLCLTKMILIYQRDLMQNIFQLW
jgi:hypothetical protein